MEHSVNRIPGPGSSKIEATRQALRNGIMNGTWPIGSRIPRESELMELFGVGKSTVREAVKSLAYVGMLEPIKGVGTFVRAMSPVNGLMDQHFSSYPLEQILVIRRALEIEAAQQAASNRSNELLARLREAYHQDSSVSTEAPRTGSRGEMPGSFHHLIFEAADNPLMLSLFTAVMAALRAAQSKGALLQRSTHALRVLDHGSLLDAIERQNVSKAAHVMALHVDRDLFPLDGFGAGDVLGEESDHALPTPRARELREAGFDPRC